jgi:hypothetical protein
LRVVWTALLIVGVGLVGSGCLHLSSEITISKDRSGEILLTYSMGENVVAQLRQLKALTHDLAKAAQTNAPSGDWLELFSDPQEPALKLWFKEQEVYGLTVKNLRVTAQGPRRSVRVQVAFRNLDELAQAPFLKASGFAVSNREDRATVLVRRLPTASEDVQPPNVKDPVVLRSLASFMSGFVVKLLLRAPGEVLETSAHKKAAHTAYWEYDFNSDPARVIELFNEDMSATYDTRQAF